MSQCSIYYIRPDLKLNLKFTVKSEKTATAHIISKISNNFCSLQVACSWKSIHHDGGKSLIVIHRCKYCHYWHPKCTESCTIIEYYCVVPGNIHAFISCEHYTILNCFFTKFKTLRNSWYQYVNKVKICLYMS